MTNRIYSVADLILAKCPIDFKKGERVESAGGIRLLFTLPVDLRRGDELLISRNDAILWAARRNGTVFWVNTEQLFTIAVNLHSPKGFQRFWDGLIEEKP